MPGCPCLRCYGFITGARLEEEADLYGAAGSRPQVVWSNGVLAPTAVGIIVQLLTPWFSNPPASTYLEYDGNRGTVTKSAWVDLLKDHICPHHPPDETGDPFFDIREHLRRQQSMAQRLSDCCLRCWRRLFARWTPV
jgi:hypothetical protein